MMIVFGMCSVSVHASYVRIPEIETPSNNQQSKFTCFKIDESIEKSISYQSNDSKIKKQVKFSRKVEVLLIPHRDHRNYHNQQSKFIRSHIEELADFLGVKESIYFQSNDPIDYSIQIERIKIHNIECKRLRTERAARNEYYGEKIACCKSVICCEAICGIFVWALEKD